MKLRFLMSHCRNNSVRDKGIGKKWVYSDTERSTVHRQCEPLQRANVAVEGSVASFYRLGNFIIPTFGEGTEISGIWATTYSLVF